VETAQRGWRLPRPDNPSPYGSPRLPPGDRGPVELAVRGELARPGNAALCARVQLLLGEKPGCEVACDVSALVEPDIGTVDALAKLQLTARRLGGSVRLWAAPSPLRELLALAGLARVIRCSEALPVEPRRQSEHGEEPGRIEEERDPTNPIP
jgi:ABC-type transporter Mla MlaB component